MDVQLREDATNARWHLRERAHEELKTVRFWERVQYPALAGGLASMVLEGLEIIPDVGATGVCFGVFFAAWVICQEARSKASLLTLQSWDLVVALSAAEISEKEK